MKTTPERIAAGIAFFGALAIVYSAISLVTAVKDIDDEPKVIDVTNQVWTSGDMTCWETEMAIGCVKTSEVPADIVVR